MRDINKDMGQKSLSNEKFREFAQKHGSRTQEEMAEAWDEKISDLTIGKALKKIGVNPEKPLCISSKK